MHFFKRIYMIKCLKNCGYIWNAYFTFVSWETEPYAIFREKHFYFQFLPIHTIIQLIQILNRVYFSFTRTTLRFVSGFYSFFRCQQLVFDWFSALRNSLYEQRLFWYLAHSQILGISLYKSTRVSSWSKTHIQD